MYLLYVFVPALQCTCRTVDVACFCHRWSSDCAPSESAGVGFGFASCTRASECLCPSYDKVSLSLTVFTVQFVFRVQLGMGHGDVTDLACKAFFSFLISSPHSEVLCESLHSVFPSDRMHLFPIATVDKKLSDRISCRFVPAEMMTSPQMD